LHARGQKSIGIEPFAPEIDSPRQTRMKLGHERRSFLPRCDGNDSGLRMAQQYLDQLSRCVSGPAENSDFDHREFLDRPPATGSFFQSRYIPHCIGKNSF
jgi:hypothetical protein